MRKIANICNPLDEPNEETVCSIACMDDDYENRSNVYPTSVNFADCPTYWKTKKVTVELVDYETDFMKGIGLYATLMGRDQDNSYKSTYKRFVNHI